MLLEPLDFFKVLFLLSHFNFPYLKTGGRKRRGVRALKCCIKFWILQRGLFSSL